jgi:phenylpropionate dioxygenase-like ring-hydroxylating dioxygenase large terminal subunit
MLGYRDRPAVPEHRIERTDTEIRVEMDMEEPVDTGKNSAIGLDSESVVTTKSYRVFLPFSAINQQAFPNGARYVLFWAFCPLDETTTRCFTFHARNFSHDARTDTETMEFTQRVVEDDRPIVEAQRRQDLPFDITEELHIRKPDAISIAFRSWLYELADQYSATSAATAAQPSP